jgi:hypothetical protein
MSTFKLSHLKFGTTPMNKLAFAIVCGLAEMAANATTAHATIVYQYVADVQNLSGSAGATSATVSFYLQETVSGTDTSYISRQNGLEDGTFQLDRLSGDGFVNSLANQTGSGGTFPGGLGGVSGNFATSSAGPWRATNNVNNTSTNGPFGTVNGAVTTVLLGTGTFNLGTTTSTYKLGKKTIGVNTQSYTDITDLDIDFASLHILGAGDITFTLQLVVAPPGDYNHNGVVDAADYTIWRDTLGSTTDLRANGDNTGASAGKIDQADYAFWKSHFGNHSGSGSGAAAAVPEPASLLLFLSGTPTLCSRRWQMGRKLINA